MPARADTWYSTKSSTSAGEALISRRPNPTRSGNPGCAPTATDLSFANATVCRITPGSPAWKPHAIFADEMLAISAASWPIGHGPNDSPRSELRSILILFLTDHFSRQYDSLELEIKSHSPNSMKSFRTVLFWIHLAVGAAAGIVIFIMSVTG